MVQEVFQTLRDLALSTLHPKAAALGMKLSHTPNPTITRAQTVGSAQQTRETQPNKKVIIMVDQGIDDDDMEEEEEEEEEQDEGHGKRNLIRRVTLAHSKPQTHKTPTKPES